MTAILAFDPAVKSNAHLIERAAQLNYLNSNMTVFDATWGLGNFWGHWAPDCLIGADIDPGKARDLCASFLDLPFPDEALDAVVFDPPYRLNGTEQVAAALSDTMRLVDELHLSSYRPQPNGTSQKHARRNYSTLQIYKKEKV